MITILVLLGLSSLGVSDGAENSARVEVGDRVHSIGHDTYLHESRGWSWYRGRPPLRVLQVQTDHLLVELKSSRDVSHVGWIPVKKAYLSKRLPDPRVVGKDTPLEPVLEVSDAPRLIPMHEPGRRFGVVQHLSRRTLTFSPDGRLVAFVHADQKKGNQIELVALAERGARRTLPNDAVLPGMAFNADGTALAIWNPAAHPPTIHVYDTKDARLLGSIRCPDGLCDHVSLEGDSSVRLSGFTIRRGLPVTPVRFADGDVVATRSTYLNELRETRWNLSNGRSLGSRILSELPSTIPSGPGGINKDAFEYSRNFHRIELLDMTEREGIALGRGTDNVINEEIYKNHYTSSFEGVIGDSVVLSSYSTTEATRLRLTSGPLGQITGIGIGDPVGSAPLSLLHERVMRFVIEPLAKKMDILLPIHEQRWLTLMSVELFTNKTRWSRAGIAASIEYPTVVVHNGVVVVATESQCKVFDADDGGLLRKIPIDPSGRISRKISISPGGRYLVVESPESGRTRVYDISTGSTRLEVFGHDIKFSPDDRHVATWFAGESKHEFHAVVPGPTPTRIRHVPTPDGLKIWRMPQEEAKTPRALR